MTERTIVHSERHVERLARAGVVAETRAALARRLLEALAPEVELATPEAARLALEIALARIAQEDALLRSVARAGGSAWFYTADAVDRAIGTIRAAGTPDEALSAAARAPGTVGARARMLRGAIAALDAELGRAGLVDARAGGIILARALGRASPDAVLAVAGTPRLVARGIVQWDAVDVAWWRALDLALSRRRGGARIETPAFDRLLDPERERDPLEIVADDLARAMDDSPLFARIDAPLGDLRCEGPAPRDARTRVDIRRAADAHAQARAVADAVHAALAAGAPVDRVAVALPRIDEDSLLPIRRALDDAGIVAHDPRGPAPIGSGLVACAMDALGLAARGLPRKDVAVLLRSRYLDAPALTGVAERREATARLLDLARALDETPTARHDEARATIAETARAFRSRSDREEEPERIERRASLAERVAELLTRATAARTHAEHATAARELLAGLGLAPRLGAGARTALANDARPEGVTRAELRALARDAHAWEVLGAALDAYESAAARLGVSHAEASGDAFRHHLMRVLEVGAPPLGAARAGAVRIARIAELAEEELTLLVVVDANDGVLPGAPAPDPLLVDGLSQLLRENAPHAAPAPHALGRARELASLALAASAAEHVTLVCRGRDEQGAAMAPSPLVAWLERAGVPSRAWRATGVAERPLSIEDARLAWLRAAPEHASRVAPDAARRAEIERRRETFFYDAARRTDAIVGALDAEGELARALTMDTGEERPLAVTALESAARCPFQGFASIVLGARDRLRRGELPDAREEGTLTHAVLAAAFRATRDLWPLRPRDAAQIQERARSAVDLVLSRELTGSPLRDVMVARVRDDVGAVLAWSLADETWDFAFAEQPFGDSAESSWPAMSIDGPGAKVVLRGKIDRVDVAHDEARVRAMDYKRSKRKAAEGARELGETAFQVPLYALVASRVLGRPAAEGLYVPTGARDLSPAYRAKEAFVARCAEVLAVEGGLAEIERAASAIVAEMRRGALAPVPRDKRACLHCDVRGGCRQPRFAVEADEDEGS